MKNVLVTGGAGFIGSNFIRFLLKAEPEVHIVNLDILTYAGSLENLQELPDPNRHTFVKGDICDRALVDELMHKHQVDTIVHFAAETHVDRSIVYPDQFLKTNVVGTFTLLEAARQYWIVEKALPLEMVRFHHISTDEVFGTLSLEDPAWDEDTPYDPSSPYSAAKAASDHYVRAWGHTFGLPYSITNCTNNYGPNQFPEKLIPLMILNAADGQPLPIYGDGKQIRDWLYVEDHCEAIWLVITKGQPGQTFNIGGGSQPTNIEVVQHLCATLDELRPNSPHAPHSKLMKFVPDRPGHDRRYAIDITKIQNTLGWQPRQSLGSGLQKTVEWYLSHTAWVKSVREQREYQKWLDKNYANRTK
ncbi:MAG TPA: dTDP-glucose 4,6-dehydratase [Anaerolineales bacterium]|nr:dTDP-glucose 4,6-dehydratase [Anaerolineales bacterium]